jgi:nitrogen fixation/metabolism regulation signal transduction histidine kinase
LVLEAAVKLLTNPLFLRIVLVLFAAGFAFLMSVLMIRRVRRSLGEDASFSASAASTEQLPLHTYHSVIQQLKQQKHELQSQQQAEQRRAKTSENISAAVLSNLSSGVLFFGANGLVRQANQAAKTILGIASPVGMNPEAIFRQASLLRTSLHASPSMLADAVQCAIRDAVSLKKSEADYLTPSGERRILEITASQIPAPDGNVLGVACLIQDRTELADMQRQIALRGELSAEMALALRSSLVTISGYAQQLAQNRDPELAQQIAADIAAEARHLDHTIGGFLASARSASATSGVS